MVPELLILALDFARQPERFGHLRDPAVPLPEGFEALVSGLGGALAPARVGDTAATLGTSPEVLAATARHLVREVLLVPGASHYRVLGLGSRPVPEVIGEHYHTLVRLLHPDRLPDGERARGVEDTARLNTAFQVLGDAGSRSRYDAELARAPRTTGHDIARRRAPGRGLVRRALPRWGLALRGRRRRSRRGLVLAALGACALLVVGWLALSGRPTLHVTVDPASLGESKPAFLAAAPRDDFPPAPSGGLGSGDTLGERSAPVGPTPSRTMDSSLGGSRPLGESAGVQGWGSDHGAAHRGTADRRPGDPATLDVTASDWGVTRPSLSPVIATASLPGYGAETPQLVLERLERHLRQGDIEALLRLLSDDARITYIDGPGTPGQTDLFRGTLNRQLILAEVDLRELEPDRFAAEAALRAAPGAGARQTAGATTDDARLRLEIVRHERGYRITAIDLRPAGRPAP